MKLPERIARVLELEPDSTAVEFNGQSYPWRFLSTLARRIDADLQASGIGEGECIGVLASNRPTIVAGIASLLMSRRCGVFIDPKQPPAQLAAELSGLKLRAVMADAPDWVPGPLVDALRATGTIGLVLDSASEQVSRYPGLERPGPGPFKPPAHGVALNQTTSGTTGPPKRTTKTFDQAEEALAIGHPQGKNEDPSALKVKRSPTLAFKSLAHGGGVTAVTLAMYEARPISLHEKFTVECFVDAVQRHKAKVAGLVPTMIRMLWDANVPREALQSLIAIRSGTAPLDPLLQKNFEEKYGIPLLIDYGGTEIGGVTGWSLADHQQYGATKRGSVGRVKRRIRVRIMDDVTGVEKQRGDVGVLEVLNPQLGSEWIRTTDLASIDDDGFMFIHGRSDGAINRGGFKVLPEPVVQALRRHELVRDAAVVGITDARLGQVPVAFVEPHPGRARPEETALVEHLRGLLPSYQVPVAIHVIDALPRTPSLKVSLGELRALHAGQTA